MTIKKPDLLRELAPVTDLQSLIQTAKQSECPIIEAHICDVVLSSEDLYGIEFQHVIFEKCTLSACAMEKISFTDSALVNCDLSNSNME